MNIKTFFCVISFGFIALAQPAMAGELLIGAKTGIYNMDLDAFDSEDPSVNASIQIGYEIFDLAIFDISGEFEFATSLTEGEAGNADFGNESFGLYAAARTAGPIYFIGRIGFIDAELDFEDTPNLEDNATAVGLGIGFSTGFRVELEVTNYSFDEIGSATYFTAGISF